MNEKELIILKEKIVQFCVSKSIKFSKPQVDIQARMMLDKFSLEDVKQALNALFYDTQFFPDASLVYKKIMNGDKTENKALADIGASKILEAGASFSQYEDPDVIMNFLGKELYGIMQRMGGIDRFARLEYSDLPTTRAQVRDMISANIKNGQIRQLDIVDGRLEDNSSGNVRKIDFKGLKKEIGIQ